MKINGQISNDAIFFNKGQIQKRMQTILTWFLCAAVRLRTELPIITTKFRPFLSNEKKKRKNYSSGYPVATVL